MTWKRADRVAHRTPLAPLFIAAALLVSCGQELPGSAELQGEWRLLALTRPDHSVTPIPDPSRFTLRFREDGRIALRADCNVCGGGYELGGDSLTTGPLACTKAFCPSAPLDSLFVGIVDGRSSIVVRNGRLNLLSDRGHLAFALWTAPLD
jgi:heat shock protein HslJ